MSCNACMIWMGWKHSYLSFLWAFNSKSQISGSIPRVSSLIAKNCIYFPVIGLNHIQCRKTIKINKKNASADGVYHPCLVKFCKVRRLLHPRKNSILQLCPTEVYHDPLAKPHSETSRHSPPNVPGAVRPSSEACQDTLGLPRSPPHISACATGITRKRNCWSRVTPPSEEVWTSWHSW